MARITAYRDASASPLLHGGEEEFVEFADAFGGFGGAAGRALKRWRRRRSSVFSSGLLGLQRFGDAAGQSASSSRCSPSSAWRGPLPRLALRAGVAAGSLPQRRPSARAQRARHRAPWSLPVGDAALYFAPQALPSATRQLVTTLSRKRRSWLTMNTVPSWLAIFFEQLQRVDVEIVGRLVEHQRSPLSRNGAPAAGGCAHRRKHLHRRDWRAPAGTENPADKVITCLRLPPTSIQSARRDEFASVASGRARRASGRSTQSARVRRCGSCRCPGASSPRISFSSVVLPMPFRP